MKLQKVYHVGIAVDNLDRAKEFHTKVLGMEYLGRPGGRRERRSDEKGKA
jgi:catechol 2,3-dioxygenase-like lactoylglutathione lyase family enzyme